MWKRKFLTRAGIRIPDRPAVHKISSHNKVIYWLAFIFDVVKVTVAINR